MSEQVKEKEESQVAWFQEGITGSCEVIVNN
jgi:hypothetical protein